MDTPSLWGLWMSHRTRCWQMRNPGKTTRMTVKITQKARHHLLWSQKRSSFHIFCVFDRNHHLPWGLQTSILRTTLILKLSHRFELIASQFGYSITHLLCRSFRTLQIYFAEWTQFGNKCFKPVFLFYLPPIHESLSVKYISLYSSSLVKGNSEGCRGV